MTPPVAVVTGAASGIGRAAALRMARLGMSVAAVDSNKDQLDQLAGFSIRSYPCDVSDASAVEKTADQIHTELGDVCRLVNAAGIGMSGRIGSAAVDDFDRAMAVNFLGLVHWVNALLPGMKARNAGELIIIASLAGWVASPGMGAYTASKFATVGFADTLTAELAATGIRVMCVCPPAVDTPMLQAMIDNGGLPPKAIARLRPITADDVVDAIDAALAKTRSSYVFPGRGSATLWRVRRFAPGLANAIFRRFVDEH